VRACGGPVPLLSAATGQGVAEVLGHLAQLVEASRAGWGREEEPRGAGRPRPT